MSRRPFAFGRLSPRVRTGARGRWLGWDERGPDLDGPTLRYRGPFEPEDIRAGSPNAIMPEEWQHEESPRRDVRGQAEYPLLGGGMRYCLILECGHEVGIDEREAWPWAEIPKRHDCWVCGED